MKLHPPFMAWNSVVGVASPQSAPRPWKPLLPWRCCYMPPSRWGADWLYRLRRRWWRLDWNQRPWPAKRYPLGPRGDGFPTSSNTTAYAAAFPAATSPGSVSFAGWGWGRPMGIAGVAW